MQLPQVKIQLAPLLYARVRQHPVLGPVFSERIADWTSHLAKITEFWARMTGGPSDYKGGMGRHFSLPVGGEHFEIWLGLWDENARALLPPEQAAEMTIRAVLTSEAIHAGVSHDLRAMVDRVPEENPIKPLLGAMVRSPAPLT